MTLESASSLRRLLSPKILLVLAMMGIVANFWHRLMAFDPTATEVGDGTIKLMINQAVPLEESMLASVPLEEAMPGSVPPESGLSMATPFADLRELEQFECVAWRATRDCERNGERWPEQDVPCSQVVAANVSGYCEFRHRDSGERRRLMGSACNSPASKLSLSCNDAPSLVQFNLLALEYEPKKPLAFATCRRELLHQNPSLSSIATTDNSFFRRGIVIVVYPELLMSVFASVRSLRELGCHLPIELWYSPSEMDTSHPVMARLTNEFSVFTRELDDPAAAKYYAKVFAVAYSAFDQILFLDADNYAVRDPSFLFEAPVFRATGAVFWPDFWQPSNSYFSMPSLGATSFVWELLGIDFVDMLEQESAQLLIDRLRHPKALTALLHYALSTPNRIQQLNLLWGDKDLFRLAWLRTQSGFHMIQRPPGSAGPTAPDPKAGQENAADVFCGVTMVQHDPDGDVLFLHRNSMKLVCGRHDKLWTHVQQFRATANMSDYRPWSHDPEGIFNVVTCWGELRDYGRTYTVRPVIDFPFAGLEDRLIAFADEIEPFACT